VLDKVREEMVEKYFFRQLQETQRDTGLMSSSSFSPC